MADPAAVIFALAMAVWVADVRLAPAPAPLLEDVASAVCESGFSSGAPAGADAEVVTCATRLAK